MRLIGRLAGHIYFIYALLVFAATMLIIWLPVFIISRMKEPLASQILHKIFLAWMGIYLPLVGIIVRRSGKHHFKKGEAYVVVCNHNSLADIPVTSPWIPGPNKTLAKVEMARIPVFGTIYTAGSILVNRKSEASRRESFQKMSETLNQGLHLCLYPEGTRNKTNKPMQPFYDGAFITAVKTQKDIIPGVLFNTGRILPHNRAGWARPMPIRLDFLPPVSVQGLTLADVPSLKESVRNIMEAHYTANL